MPALKSGAPHSGASAVACLSQLLETRVAMRLDSTHYLLADGRPASRALSCLVEPLAGDVVLVAQGDSGCHVLHVLTRGDGATETVALSLPGDGAMAWRARRFSLHALDAIDLVSARDASLTAAGGNLSLVARNLFATVSDSLVQQARHVVGKAGHYLLEVRQLLRLHGQDVLMTAERDIKADAERISMG